MRPTKLRVRGLASFPEEVEVDFDGLGLFAITGPTGAGKTSLLTAMTAALYGRAPEVADDLRQLITTGSTEARILFEFDAGGRRYRAQRVIHRARNAEVRLDVWDGTVWKPLIRGAREARGEVEKILGLPYEAFTKVVLLPQGQVADFLRGRGQDRRKIMIDLLGLEIYQRIQQAANTESSAAQAAADTLQQMLERDYADATAEQLRQVQTALAAAHARLEALTARLALVDNAVEAARREHASAEQCARAEAEEQTARDAVTVAERELVTARDVVERLTAEAERIERQIASLGYDPARHLALQRAESEAGRLITARERSTELTKEEREGVERQAALAAQLAEADETLAGERQQLVSQETRSAEARDALAAIEEEVGTRVEVARLRERARQYAADLRDLAAAKADREAVQGEITTLAGTVEHAAGAKRTAEEALARAEQEAERDRDAFDQWRVALQQADRAEGDLGEARERHVRAERAHGEASRGLIARERAEAEAQALLHEAQAAERIASAALQAERERHMAHVLRQHVNPGQPCPVCERPVDVLPPSQVLDLDAAEAVLEHARAAREAVEERLADARGAAARAAERALSTETDRQQAAQALAAAETTLSDGLPLELRGRREWRAALQQAVVSAERQAAQATAALREGQRGVQAATAALSELRAEHASLGRALADRNRAIDELAARCAAASTALERAIARSAGRDLDAFLADIEQRLHDAAHACEETLEVVDAARGRVHDAEQARQRIRTALDRERDAATHRNAEAARLSADIETLERSVRVALGVIDAAALAALPVQLAGLAAKKADLDKLNAASRDVDAHLVQGRERSAQAWGNVEAARQRAKGCRNALEQAQGSWGRAKQTLEEAATVGGIDPREAALDRIAGHRARLAGEREQALHEQGAHAAEERSMGERIERATTLREELACARHKAAVARELGQLLGGQQLQNWLLAEAMGLLVEDASAHLERLSDRRYRLQVRDLDFDVMDRWNADAVRSVKTLSGGETFLAALALALALADRVAGRAEAARGQHPLESLFIDEGFGTLDAGETLENVAEALRQLQTTHRVIGVVTHLPQLAEQLPAQIRVIKDVGRSRLEMVMN